jgi:hypothetical protein
LFGRDKFKRGVGHPWVRRHQRLTAAAVQVGDRHGAPRRRRANRRVHLLCTSYYGSTYGCDHVVAIEAGAICRRTNRNGRTDAYAGRRILQTKFSGEA